VESVAAGFAGGGAHHIVGTTLVATVAERRDAPDPAVCLAVGVDEVLEQGEITPVEVGDERCMEFAVLGDSVNVASHLESLCRELGAALTVSDALIARARDAGDPGLLDGFVAIGPQRLKGLAT
jgi:adenylate cyclase